MTTQIIDPAAEAAVGTDEVFVDLVCADDDLLRAEFEAIIEANWPAPPGSSARLPWPDRPTPRGSRRRSVPTIAPSVRRAPADGRGGRQRSPPPPMEW